MQAPSGMVKYKVEEITFFVLRKDFQKDLLHNLPKYWGQADWSVVPWILLVLLDAEYDICLFLVIEYLPWLP